MQRKPKSKRAGRHALLAAGATLVLAASPVAAAVGAGSASAAESPHTSGAQWAPDVICVETAEGTECSSYPLPTGYYPYYHGGWGGILKALQRTGLGECHIEPNGVKICTFGNFENR